MILLKMKFVFVFRPTVLRWVFYFSFFFFFFKLEQVIYQYYIWIAIVFSPSLNGTNDGKKNYDRLHVIAKNHIEKLFERNEMQTNRIKKIMLKHKKDVTKYHVSLSRKRKRGKKNLKKWSKTHSTIQISCTYVFV